MTRAECDGLPDNDLVALTRTRPEAFGCIIERYERRLMRYVRRLALLSKEDAEDALQNVFLAAYRNINEFDTDLSFSSWIYRIAHNEAISILRRRRTAPIAESALGSEDDETAFFERVAGTDDVLANAARGELRDLVRGALDRLDEKYRDILVLRYMEEKEYAEISDILKLPPGTVAIRLSRGKDALKKELLAGGYHENV